MWSSLSVNVHFCMLTSKGVRFRIADSICRKLASTDVYSAQGDCSIEIGRLYAECLSVAIQELSL